MTQLSKEPLPIWVIYRPTTKDFPGKWVARLHLCLPEGHQPTDKFMLAETLQGVRELIPLGLYRLGRDPTDDPIVEESWL